jgi:hypothetical protein
MELVRDHAANHLVEHLHSLFGNIEMLLIRDRNLRGAERAGDQCQRHDGPIKIHKPPSFPLLAPEASFTPFL